MGKEPCLSVVADAGVVTYGKWSVVLLNSRVVVIKWETKHSKE